MVAHHIMDRVRQGRLGRGEAANRNIVGSSNWQHTVPLNLQTLSQLQLIIAEQSLPNLTNFLNYCWFTSSVSTQPWMFSSKYYALSEVGDSCTRRYSELSDSVLSLINQKIPVSFYNVEGYIFVPLFLLIVFGTLIFKRYVNAPFGTRQGSFHNLAHPPWFPSSPPSGHPALVCVCHFSYSLCLTFHLLLAKWVSANMVRFWNQERYKSVVLNAKGSRQ